MPVYKLAKLLTQKYSTRQHENETLIVMVINNKRFVNNVTLLPVDTVELEMIRSYPHSSNLTPGTESKPT